MLRSDFDNHTLWSVLDRIDDQLTTIVAEHQPPEMPSVERIKTQMAYVRSFDVVASTRAAFFHPQMLTPVQAIWESVESSLSTRVGNGVDHTNYLQQAADQAETGLLQMAAWPRPYGRGGEVNQMNTLFEQLLEAQRISIEALESEHEKLRNEIAEYNTQVESKRDEVNAELLEAEAKLETLQETIEEQKSELAAAVAEAEAAVEALDEKNSAAYKEWRTAREADFNEDFQPLRDSVAERLGAAEAEYGELIGAKEKYTKLVSAIAADEVASQFESEADWGRRVGNRFYLLGFALLLVATVPLIWLIFDGTKSGDGAVNWTAIITRVAIGILAGSAATVAIRLGSRLINNANAIKRMELELRAIGPFLANVSEKPKVDDAFIELVGKAFGNTYAETTSTGGKESTDDKTSVTTLAQLLEVIDKARKVIPPGQTPG
ncbi:hypothetical protein [Microbacterium maritypicum]|uniref:Uncharacterized protein n=1 Tax=Microbacterium maritypicum TaxID=33918 RepID=A0A4Y4BC36_MICMQ|nr:hypothetical protein [Microbacterium liquefaciens]GEC76213.1 hypothetical protein MLI01_23580 [Microbacterium liquefaciens]GGV59292.1 hypothetical protein GCM10010213_21730 [Microbacterium liquefaciens]